MNTQDKQKLESICELVQIKKFIPALQFRVLADYIKSSEESEFFQGKVKELKATIENMPGTYDQDGLGDNAIVHLHYFGGSFDAWITELNKEDEGNTEAFGYVDLGDGAECGYVSIGEFTDSSVVEIDLHFKPRTIGEILKERN